jgi:hypothetical protein
MQYKIKIIWKKNHVSNVIDLASYNESTYNL